MLLERGRAKLLGFRRNMSEALLAHELTANAVGLVIEQLLGLRVRPELERRIRAADPHARGKPARQAVSDLWVPGGEHPRPVEIELTQKAEVRYKELWRNFSRAYPYGSQVLYLAGWPGGVEFLLKLTKGLENWGGWMVYVCSLRDFRESLGRCAFVNDTYPWRQSLTLAEPVAGPADRAIEATQRFRVGRSDASS